VKVKFQLFIRRRPRTAWDSNGNIFVDHIAIGTVWQHASYCCGGGSHLPTILETLKQIKSKSVRKCSKCLDLRPTDSTHCFLSASALARTSSSWERVQGARFQREELGCNTGHGQNSRRLLACDCVAYDVALLGQVQASL
jgi:hypothetical protein